MLSAEEWECGVEISAQGFQISKIHHCQGVVCIPIKQEAVVRPGVGEATLTTKEIGEVEACGAVGTVDFQRTFKRGQRFRFFAHLAPHGTEIVPRDGVVRSCDDGALKIRRSACRATRVQQQQSGCPLLLQSAKLQGRRVPDGQPGRCERCSIQHDG